MQTLSSSSALGLEGWRPMVVLVLNVSIGTFVLQMQR